MPGTLVICATPIGNLGDISSRLAEELAAADVIFAEDTRRTAKLLNHLGISTPMRSYFAGNERRRSDELVRELEADRRVAVVSDAGTPVISDPGASAVEAAVGAGAQVTAIPGPSAPVVALSISGFQADRFVFEGFLPRKGKDRSSALKGLRSEQRTAVVFAAPSRVARDLADLADVCGSERRVVVARELTKLYEEVWRSTLREAADHFSDPARARGEFCIVVEGATVQPPSVEDAVVAALLLIEGGATTSDAVREAASTFGVSRRELYERVLADRPRES